MTRALASALFALTVTGFLALVPASAAPSDTTAAPEQPALATPALIREIQFMLMQLGFDPGPLDGNALQLTNKAVHAFQQHAGLPSSDIVNNAPVSPIFLLQLRKETMQLMMKNMPVVAQPAPAPAVETAAVPPPPPAPPPPPPPPPKVDRFASCAFEAADFRMGAQQYTPQSFLEEGFGGSTPRALAALHQRLEEARQIADKLGGPALMEVQRQARVVAYFECRQKIEQNAATKN